MHWLCHLRCSSILLHRLSHLYLVLRDDFKGTGLVRSATLTEDNWNATQFSEDVVDAGTNISIKYLEIINDLYERKSVMAILRSNQPTHSLKVIIVNWNFFKRFQIINNGKEKGLRWYSNCNIRAFSRSFSCPRHWEDSWRHSLLE